MTTTPPLPQLLFEPLVRAALLEDLGRAGDITSDAIVPPDRGWHAVLRARQAGVVAGQELAKLAFRLVDQDISYIIDRPDGEFVAAGTVLAHISGLASGILAAERTALNCMCHLSGIATTTRRLVEAVRPHETGIVCTRKTTPGLRALEKYAVRVGGGANHRFGLDDAILIKDNHIAVAGGIKQAVMAARNSAGHLVKIEVEVDNLDQLREILTLPVDSVLLDNMDNEMLRAAVDLVAGRMMTEASGRITLETVAGVAATGVDLIAVGWITHSAPVLDIGLDAI